MGPIEIDCRFIEDHLEEILVRAFPSDTVSAVNHHLARCSACRQLIEIAECRQNPWPADATPDFTQAVLEKTSGAACKKARTLVCAWADHELGQEEGELLGSHLKYCRACQALAVTLMELKADLPTMAEVTPDPGFCLSILKETVANRSWKIRAVKWWESLFQRPRFAWEAAYLGTLVIFGLLGVIPGFKATNGLSAVGVLSHRPVAFLESIQWNVPTLGELQDPLASRLASSLDIRISTVRRGATSSLEEVRHVTRQAWIVGFTASSDGAGWLRKKAMLYLWKLKSYQHNLPLSNSTSKS